MAAAAGQGGRGGRCVSGLLGAGARDVPFGASPARPGLRGGRPALVAGRAARRG